MPNSNMACYRLLPNCHESPTIMDAARLSLSTGLDACFAFLCGFMQWCLDYTSRAPLGQKKSRLDYLA
jgi:hypothetical protein